MMTREDRITELVRRSQAGDVAASEELMPLIYDQLRGLAQRYMAGERRDHTLQPTALVHEAYVRLVRDPKSSWESRAHFFGAAATAVRRILVEHARARQACPRHRRESEGVDVGKLPAAGPDGNILAVDEALRRLTEQNPQQARLVELRFFGGLTIDEVAATLGMSPRTAARDWVVAKAWLARELREGLGFDD